MPFIRHTRDKRGYEATYVMHAYRAASGPHRTRILYLFRSPGSVRIGRQPLDDEVREALEHTHPDLSFDWPVLVKESGEPTRAKAGVPSAPRSSRTAPKPAPPPAAVPADDDTLLGRVAGAETAARLRARHGEWMNRVARRARSPEERDRLTGRLRRLNPDEWPDEATIRAHVGTIEAEWAAIGADLPARRRGRRGGRRRSSAATSSVAQAPEAAAASEAPEPSGIIEQTDEAQNVLSPDSSAAEPDRPADAAGDSRGGRPADAADAPPSTAADVPSDD